MVARVDPLVAVCRPATPERMTGHGGSILAKPRLPVAAAFVGPNGGAVVMGFLTGGPFECGQDVVIQPSGRRARIRELRSGTMTAGVVQPGRWVIASLANLDPGSSSPPAPVVRGEVVTVAGLEGATDTVDVLVEPSAWLVGAAASHEPVVPGGARLLPSHRAGEGDLGPQQPRPTRFMAGEQVRKEQGALHEPPVPGGARTSAGKHNARSATTADRAR